MILKTGVHREAPKDFLHSGDLGVDAIRMACMGIAPEEAVRNLFGQYYQEFASHPLGHELAVRSMVNRGYIVVVDQLYPLAEEALVRHGITGDPRKAIVSLHERIKEYSFDEGMAQDLFELAYANHMFDVARAKQEFSDLSDDYVTEARLLLASGIGRSAVTSLFYCNALRTKKYGDKPDLVFEAVRKLVGKADSEIQKMKKLAHEAEDRRSAELALCDFRTGITPAVVTTILNRIHWEEGHDEAE